MNKLLFCAACQLIEDRSPMLNKCMGFGFTQLLKSGAPVTKTAHPCHRLYLNCLVAITMDTIDIHSALIQVLEAVWRHLQLGKNSLLL